METINKMFTGNQEWVSNKSQTDEMYFEKMSGSFSPEILWIGCGDCPVSPQEITQSEPGEIFVHNNMANMVLYSDMNMVSALDYAINFLKVKHVIVCGHYMCGGVSAAMKNTHTRPVGNWIRHLKYIYRENESELDLINDELQQFDRLVEMNVYKQVFALSRTFIVQNAWKKGSEPQIHGWVFDVKTGTLKDLGISFNCNSKLPDIYKVGDEMLST